MDRFVLAFRLLAEAFAGEKVVEAGGPQYESPAVAVNKNVEVLVVVRNRNQTPVAVQPPAQVTP